MNWYATSLRMSELQSECLGLIKRARELEPEGPGIRAWRTDVSATFDHAFPESASFRSEFQGLWEQEGELSIEILFAQSMELLSRAQNDVLSMRYGQERKTLETEVEHVITSIYFRKRWFYLPSALLVGALAFVVVGAVQIGDIKFDIEDKARRALAEAPLEIKQRTNDMSGRIQEATDEASLQLSYEVARLKESVDMHLTTTLPNHLKTETKRVTDADTDDLAND